MGEKDIVEDVYLDGGQPMGPGGPTGTTGNPPFVPPGGLGIPGGGAGGGGGAPKTGGGPSGGPGGDAAGGGDDCADLEFKMRDLKEALENLRKENESWADKAADSFYGNEGYRDTVQKAGITAAVVDSNNAVGKTMIDAALFAAGGYGGIAKAGGMSTATAEAWFGGGIYGSKDATAAIQGIGAFLGQQTGAKVPGAKEVAGGSMTGMADAAKNAVIDGLSQWMKDGATSPGIEAAKKGYADFVGKATATNAAAAGAADIKKQMDELAKQAKAKNCPPEIYAIPNTGFKTFDMAPFGQGPHIGQAGPNMRTTNLDGTPRFPPSDLFQKGSKGNLPGY